jgi:hypothetical protein
VAPFCFDFVGGSRRPDLAAFLLLGGVGLWSAARRPEPVALGIIAGAALAVTTFFSEAGPLMVGPWLVLVVCADAQARDASRRVTMRAAAAVIAPAAVVLAVLAAVGRATPSLIQALESKAPLASRGHGTIFPYLDDTISTSIHKVLDHPGHLELSIIAGLALVALMLSLVRSHLRDIFTTFRWVLPSTPLRALWLAGAGGTAFILFALAFDWLRWFASIGLGGLLAIATIALMLSRSSQRPATRGDWEQSMPTHFTWSPTRVLGVGVATTLLALPPLPASIR